jgi:hypothetical protein
MHIPNGTTAELELLTFEEALKAAQTPSADYDIGKWLYAPNFYSEYRYILGTIGSKPLICIGINPSTAEPDNLDPTLQSVARIAAGNGFDSFIMFNVYAQRATRPDDMDKTWNKELHRENMLAFEHILKHIPIIIREDELIVGSSTLAPRGCQTFPEFSYEWLEAEFDTVHAREADPFEISEKAKMRSEKPMLTGREKLPVNLQLHIWSLKH